MRIGYVQFSPVLGDLEANRLAVASLVGQAENADLLVLPELCNSGYRFRSRDEAMEAAEPVPSGPFVRHLTQLSAQHRLVLVAGLLEKAGVDLYNSAVVVGPSGLIGHYRKAHLFWDEKDIFRPGNTGFSVFDLEPARLFPSASGPTVRIGVLICFDWQFPEAWRVLALKGAQIVCHPSNLILPGKAQSAVPVLAMLNRIFTVTANRIGRERDLAFTGRSFMAAPSGEILAEASADREEVRVIECDPREALNKEITPRNDLLGDRRPELYTELLHSRVSQPKSEPLPGQKL
jgi:predicted amidohydrolase